MTSREKQSRPLLTTHDDQQQRQHHGGGMERRKSSKHNGPPTPWKRKPLLQEDEVDSAPPQRRVKRIKLRLSEGPASRPSSRDGGGSLMKPVQGEGEGSSIPKGDSKKESDLVSQPLSATSGNVKLEEGSSSHFVGPGPPLIAAPPTILTRIKAQPRNANERAMMQDIETLETMLQLGSYRSSSSVHATDPQPLPLPQSASRHCDAEGPARSLPPLWARTAEDLCLVTTLCPSPNKSKSKAKLSPVMVKSSRSGIARGLLLTRRPMVGQDVAPKIGREDGRWEFELVVRNGRKGKGKGKVSGVMEDEPGAVSMEENNAVATSSKIKLEDTLLSLRDTSSPPPSIGQLVASDPSSFALYRAWEHRTSLYLFLARPCVCSSGSECACSEQGGLSMLPCKLPVEVGAVAVGWARVVGAELVVDEAEGAGEGAATTKVRWQMQVAVDEGTWWLPEARGTGAASPAWTSTRPPSHQIAATSNESSTSPPTPSPFNVKIHSLLTSPPCPNCHLSLPRHHWSHYLCPNCGTRIDAYVPCLASGNVDFGTTSVPTEGPRMDNGRAVWDKGRVRRELRVVQEDEGATFKCVEYSWPSTAPSSVPGPSTSSSATASATSASAPSLIHLLASGPWTRHCKTHLSWLLAPAMPYERRTNQSNVFDLEVALCSRSKRSKRKAHEPLLLELTGLGDINLASRLVELVEEVEQRVGVAAAAAAVAGSGQGPRVATRAHLTVLGCDNVKHRLDLPSSSTNGSGVTYLHLGAPATLSVTTTEGVAGSGHKVRTMMNAMVVSGDVVWVPGREQVDGTGEGGEGEGKGQVTVTIEAKALCVGMMLVE